MHWESHTGLVLLHFNLYYHIFIGFFVVMLISGFFFFLPQTLWIPFEKDGFSEICAWRMFSLGSVLAFAVRWSGTED